MSSLKKSYTINKIYFPIEIENKDEFLKLNDEYFNSLSCVYKTSTFLYEDVLYYNIQMDFTENKLSQIDFNRILDHSNEYNKGPIIKRAFYKFKKNTEDLKLNYKYIV